MTILRPFVQSLRELRNAVRYWRYADMSELIKMTTDRKYRAYLELQLRRTLSKKDTPLQIRTMALVDKLASLIPLDQCDVLCVGCRNRAELDYFETKGTRSVKGVDLYSEDPRIIIMDMHRLEFPAGSFDIVYSSHSLEHALFPQQVAAEFIRVVKPGGYLAIEVPIQFEVRGADLVDFGHLEALVELFGGNEERVVWSEALPVNTEKVDLIPGAVRVIIQTGV